MGADVGWGVGFNDGFCEGRKLTIGPNVGRLIAEFPTLGGAVGS